MSKRKRFRLNGNNWLLLVVFALASFFARVEPFVILAGAGIAVNLFMALTCHEKREWDEEAFKRNLAEASIDDKIVSLILWTLTWAVLLKFDYSLLVLCSVFARSLSGIFVRVS
jgi:hypothetical protein